MTVKDLERFMKKTLPNPVSGCWDWRAYKNSFGYGIFFLRGKHCRAHRAVLQLTGPGPSPLQVVDHLCRNRACVNPSHLRVCDVRSNTLAPGSLAVTKTNADKTHCPLGHALIEPNLVQGHLVRGWRWCLSCARASGRFGGQANCTPEEFQGYADVKYSQIMASKSDARSA